LRFLGGGGWLWLEVTLGLLLALFASYGLVWGEDGWL
jgi:hypothetical protein